MKNPSGPTKRPIVCTLGSIVLSGSTIFKSFTREIPTNLQACTISFGHGNMWSVAIGSIIGSNVSIVKPRGHVSCLAFFYKWIGVAMGGEHFDWIKRDVATLLVKGNDVYTTLEALGVLYYLYFYEFSILFIFVGVMLF